MIPPDEMTPRERMDAFKKGLPIDRIPCAPMVGEHVTRIIGVPVSAYLHSVDLMVEAQAQAFRYYGYDGVGLGPGHHGLAEALGARLHYPDDDRPQVIAPAISDYSQLDDLQPVEVDRNERLSSYLQALERIRDRIGDRVKVSTGVGGPFTAAAFVRGTDDFLKDLRRNPEKVHDLMRLTTASILNYMDAAHKRGFSCSLGDPIASSTVISPSHFRQFVKPYLMQIVAWAVQKTGSAPSLHICGDTVPIWMDMAETGVSSISVDNQVDLESIKNAIGDRVALKGNVDPVAVMLHGTPDEVRRAGRNCIKQAGDSPGGFVLSSGCTLALNTPRGNVQALMDAARMYGRKM